MVTNIVLLMFFFGLIVLFQSNDDKYSNKNIYYKQFEFWKRKLLSLVVQPLNFCLFVSKCLYLIKRQMNKLTFIICLIIVLYVSLIIFIMHYLYSEILSKILCLFWRTFGISVAVDGVWTQNINNFKVFKQNLNFDRENN